MGISEDIKLFETKLNDAINASMQTIVAETIRTQMIDAIEEEVYAAYTPTQYVRKRGSGGLTDRGNIQITAFDPATHEIEMQNMRSDGRLVAPVVVGGVGYEWKRSLIYQMQPFPRDFYKKTDEIMGSNSDVVDALKEGLSAYGFVCE